MHFAFCILQFALLTGCWKNASPGVNETRSGPPAVDLSPLDGPVREAIEEAQKAVRAEPQSAAKWGELGKLLLAHELPIDAALECLAQAERRQPGSPEWPYLQGVWLARSDPERGIAKMRRAVELGGDEEMTARMRLAETLAAEEQLIAAQREVDYVLARSPGSARARLLVGRLALSQGKLEEARDALEKAQSDPLARPAALALLAEVHQRLGTPNPALQGKAGVGRALAWPDKYADDVTAMRRGRRAELAVADALLARNRPTEALAAAKSTIERYPEFGWAWLLSGRAHLQLNDARQAEKDLRRSIELLPDSVESHFYLGAALVGQGRTADAAEAFRRAAEITPDFAQAHYYLAECQAKLGVMDQAVASYRRAVAGKPDFVAAHMALARLLRTRGEVDEAREHAQAAVAVEPGNAEARRILAELSGRDGGNKK